MTTPNSKLERGYSSPLRIRIQMTDKDVLEKCLSLFPKGRLVGPKKQTGLGTKDIYEFILQGIHAYNILKIIQPNLGQRRMEQVQHALTKYEQLPHRQSNRPLEKKV